jgi:hypothetical protein
MEKIPARQLATPSPNNLRTALVADTMVDRVVRELNQLHSRATLETALKMGELIVERFYGNDLTAWRQKRAKEVSFRRLAARADVDLRVSATLLYRAVALYELKCRLGEERLAGLSMTHLRAVLGLAEEDQTALLAAAEQRQWSTERLEEEAMRVRGAMVQRRGRPPAPAIVKAFRRVVGSWKYVECALEQQSGAELSPGETQSLYRAVDEMKTRLEKMARRLASRSRG